nr:MAG TPA: hypothetical protein [Caudoviricetes sp.]
MNSTRIIPRPASFRRQGVFLFLHSCDTVTLARVWFLSP